MPKPRRTDEEKLEDLFVDLPLEGQAAMLESLAKLHRWCTRERSRIPDRPAKPPQQSAPAANGADVGTEPTEGAQA